MEYKQLTQNTKIPVIGLGTWTIGGNKDKDTSEDEKSIKGIKEAIKLGYTHMDTAEVYGAGHSEELVGQAIKDFDRKKLFITTKVFRTNLKYDDLITSAKDSLKKLGTDYIDLYLIHAPNPEIPIEETMKAMDYLVKEKLVRFIGVSNFSVNQIKEAQKHTQNKIVANQIPYSLISRNSDMLNNCSDMEKEIIPYCQKNNIIIVAYRPIERGKLLKPNPILEKLSKKYNKTKSQIAMNWLISKKNMITIPKSTNPKHLKENLGSMGWNMEDKDIKLLDETNFDKLR